MGLTSAFLEAVQARHDDPVLRGLSGTIRFDLLHDGSIEPWLITMTDGGASVSHRKAKADCIARMEEDLFARLTLGEVNAVSAALRGEIEIEGDVSLLLAFQRLFPGPPVTKRSGTEKTGARDDGRTRQDPPRQHLRRQ